MTSLWQSYRLIFGPVKGQDRSRQIQTAIAVASFRHWAHWIVLYAVVGSFLLLFGMWTGLPWGIDLLPIVTAPFCLLLGLFLMNRLVHLEREFKPLPWRIEARSLGDPELKKLLKLPFPVQLRKCSHACLEDRLKGFGGNSSSLDEQEFIKEVTLRVVSEMRRRQQGG